MTKPQQPELARSGRGEVDPGAVKTRHGGPTDETAPRGPVPEDNLPGHRPEHDQDKPEGPPPRPRPRAKSRKVIDLTDARPEREETEAAFDFEFENRMKPFSFAFGATPWTTGLDITDGQLSVRFGLWSLKTPLDNVAGAEVTGPYSFVKVAGPPHLSLADRGLTFATSTRRGVCIRFKQPVSVLPLMKHTALTVTVEEPDRLVELLG